MELKIMICTPKGCASRTQKQLKPLIIGFKKVEVETFVNEEDSQLIWNMKGSVRACLKAQRNVAVFDSIIKNIFSNKLVKKAVDKKDLPELEEMLNNHTTVEIIKKATAEELDENNKTWWSKIKEKWKRKTT